MEDPGVGFRSSSLARGSQAQTILADLFADAGWKVRHQVLAKVSRDADYRPRADLLIHRQGVSYAVEVKAAAEGRSDRLIPLWSQAYLQAACAADDQHRPLAVVAAPRVAPRVAEQVLQFAERYAPNAAAGVIDFRGLRMFRGHHLEDLNSEERQLQLMEWRGSVESPDLFSDLNQWMLKVLLAPELPPNLLSAPRDYYRNASQLAKAAKVSNVSAYRFLHQLRRDGYLHESVRHLGLVRREDLFRNWQLSAMRRIKEVPMRFLLRGNQEVELSRMLRSHRACLALFAAAEALKIGFVHGVPPHVYAQHLDRAGVAAWKNVVRAEPNEVPDLIVRQASAPHSIFRGAVSVDGVLVSDIIQIWLDVSSHPSRGKEQADLIRRRLLEPIIAGESSHGRSGTSRAAD